MEVMELHSLCWESKRSVIWTGEPTLNAYFAHISLSGLVGLHHSIAEEVHSAASL